MRHFKPLTKSALQNLQLYVPQLIHMYSAEKSLDGYVTTKSLNSWHYKINRVIYNDKDTRTIDDLMLIQNKVAIPPRVSNVGQL